MTLKTNNCIHLHSKFYIFSYSGEIHRRWSRICIRFNWYRNLWISTFPQEGTIGWVYIQNSTRTSNRRSKSTAFKQGRCLLGKNLSWTICTRRKRENPLSLCLAGTKKSLVRMAYLGLSYLFWMVGKDSSWNE